MEYSLIYFNYVVSYELLILFITFISIDSIFHYYLVQLREKVSKDVLIKKHEKLKYTTEQCTGLLK